MEITLDKLPVGKMGLISKLNNNDNLKRRLLDLGFVKGVEIKTMYKSPFNDPICYLIKGSLIAIRKKDGLNIIINIKDDLNGIN